MTMNNKKSQGEIHPIKYKFWCILREIIFNLFLWIRNIYTRIDKIHYDYWTHGKTLKEYKSEAILKQKKCHNYQTGDCNLSFKYCINCDDYWNNDGE
jgi:hypothetical protein